MNAQVERLLDGHPALGAFAGRAPHFPLGKAIRNSPRPTRTSFMLTEFVMIVPGLSLLSSHRASTLARRTTTPANTAQAG